MEETKKIRIGNDIKISLGLSDEKYSGSINIMGLTAIIVNTTKLKEEEERLKKKTRFISRYPIEPKFDGFAATKSNLNNSGYPTYRVMPNSHFSGTYAGFGVNPDWDSIYHPYKKHNLYEYFAQVTATGETNVVNIYFPASAQLFTGDYKLIIVAKLAQSGYSVNGVRTVTVDYDNVFTLVDSSADANDSLVATILIDTPLYTDINLLTRPYVQYDSANGFWFNYRTLLKYKNYDNLYINYPDDTINFDVLIFVPNSDENVDDYDFYREIYSPLTDGNFTAGTKLTKDNFWDALEYVLEQEDKNSAAIAFVCHNQQDEDYIDTSNKLSITQHKKIALVDDNYLNFVLNNNGVLNFRLLDGSNIELDLSNDLNWGEY